MRVFCVRFVNDKPQNIHIEKAFLLYYGEGIRYVEAEQLRSHSVYIYRVVFYTGIWLRIDIVYTYVRMCVRTLHGSLLR